jgi:hypothetical protein
MDWRGAGTGLLVVVALLASGWGSPPPARAQGAFADVPPGHWAYDAVNELAALGILKGYPAAPPRARPADRSKRMPGAVRDRQGPGRTLQRRPAPDRSQPRRPARKAPARGRAG